MNDSLETRHRSDTIRFQRSSTILSFSLTWPFPPLTQPSVPQTTVGCFRECLTRNPIPNWNKRKPVSVRTTFWFAIIRTFTNNKSWSFRWIYSIVSYKVNKIILYPSYFIIFMLVFFNVGRDETIDVTNIEPERNIVVHPHAYNDTFLYSPGQETMYECSARLLFVAIRWAKNLPSFANLPFRDQV